MLFDLLQDFVGQKKLAGWPDFVIKNSLKEYLQFPVLAFFYSRPNYREGIFMGGSALRIVYGLPRLSEDLDFDWPVGAAKPDLVRLGEEIIKYFQKEWRLAATYRAQGEERLYLKFPILKDLDLAAGTEESNFLYVKLEFSAADFIAPEYEVASVSGFGFNFIVKTYSLKFLMTGKISAIFSRAWYKGKTNDIDIKGRDYYDLYWYFNKGVEPDWATLTAKFGIKNMAELKVRLQDKIKTAVTARKLRYDLINFFPEQEFITGFCDNYREIMKKYLF